MVAPRWINSLCQPIDIRDVIFYLSHALLNKKQTNKIFDIGGPEIFSFKELLLKYAKFRNLKRWIIDIPILTPRLSSYWLFFITSVPYSLCCYLVESMKTDTVVQLGEIAKITPKKCFTCQESLDLAFQTFLQNGVISNLIADKGRLKDHKKILVKDSKEAAIERIWRIGGKNGYYALNWAWRLRGLLDEMVGGIGLNRGRRNPTEIQSGDFIDFWKVIVADKHNGQLILHSEMKMPGQAWLQFHFEQKDHECFLVQTAIFRPKGVLGRLYWYTLLPFHLLIFQKKELMILESRLSLSSNNSPKG